uniref:Uncharacterized protein n=1 Tax=Knipowitschia caucasica TaxID=637954 RepID=A0AAV2JCL2_KNICA
MLTSSPRAAGPARWRLQSFVFLLQLPGGCVSVRPVSRAPHGRLQSHGARGERGGQAGGRSSVRGSAQSRDPQKKTAPELRGSDAEDRGPEPRGSDAEDRGPSHGP